MLLENSNNFLGKLHDFNTGEALGALGGNMSLYQSILRRFTGKYRNMGETVNELIASAKVEDLCREAHTMKGLGGSLGIPYMQESAKALEMACKEKDPDLVSIKTLADAFLADLDRALQTIDEALPPV